MSLDGLERFAVLAADLDDWCHVRNLVVTTAWLIDKSAIGRLHLAANADAWADRIE